MTDRQNRRTISPGQKFAQVRNGARQVFLRDGYAGASVDDIARMANVSKATLYAYFPDKRMMFEAVLRAELDNDAPPPLETVVTKGLTATEALPRLAEAIAAWIGSEAEIRLFRLVVAEATRFPGIAAEWQARFDRLVVNPLRDQFRDYAENGQLQIGDATLAARQFVRLCATGLADSRLLHLADPDPDAVERSAASAAQVFLRAHAAKARSDDDRPAVMKS